MMYGGWWMYIYYLGIWMYECEYDCEYDCEYECEYEYEYE